MPDESGLRDDLEELREMRQQPIPVMPVGVSLRAMAIGSCPSGPSLALLPLREPAGSDRITRDTPRTLSGPNRL